MIVADHRDLIIQCADHIGVKGLLVGDEETDLQVSVLSIIPRWFRWCTLL
jgi:hypothetical protein